MKHITRPLVPSPCATKSIACWAIICSALLPALAQAQATARALTGTQSTAGCTGADGLPSGTSTSVVSIATLANGDGGCTARGSGFAFAGVVGASSQALFNGGGQNGAVFAEAGAGWTDALTAVWPERFSVTGVDKLTLTFNIGATGGVSTSGSVNPQGSAVGRGQADIGYSFTVASPHAEGTMRVSTGSAVQETGTWGTITGAVELLPVSGDGNNYVFGSFGLNLAGLANARAIHIADPTMPILTAQSDAEFGSTLIWEGIIEAREFDRLGAEIALPDGFEVGLIGNQTGMNYWNAALREPAALPEPASWALAVTALCLLSLRKRGGG